MNDYFIPAEVDTLARNTFIGQLSHKTRTALLRAGMLMELPVGSKIYRPGDESRLVIILEGVIRMFRGAPDGRHMAVRYAGQGEIMGLVAVVGGPVDLGVEILEAARGWVIPATHVRALAHSDAQLAWLIAQECARRVYGLLDELTSATFEPIRIRLIRHLLSFARHPDRPTNVRVTQQELADSLATSREVVARSLREFREKKWISTQPDSPGLIRIENPTALRHELPPLSDLPMH
ncbi:MAG: Crp/Fnr family transcriptional regulator [Leptospiraceae bacterium]|nr:Crp/Fnr family transcriptional regulator [Leptospiraceae bacterium]